MSEKVILTMVFAAMGVAFAVACYLVIARWRDEKPMAVLFLGVFSIACFVLTAIGTLQACGIIRQPL